MQSTEARTIHVCLAASIPGLIQPAEDYVRGLAGEVVEVSSVSHDQFEALDDIAESARADLIVLAVQADDEGHIDLQTAFARVSLDSAIPVMVLRAIEGKPVTFPAARRLIVPLDGSSTAAQSLPLATRMATLTGLPVTFVMVIDPSRVIPAAFAYDPEAWGIISDLRQTAHWALRQAEDQLRRDGITVESDLLFGPVNACLGEIIGEGDVVVMTTHGSGRAARSRVGSVAARILASVPQPIVIMRASIQGDVIVDGYEACSWVEPLSHRSRA